jgi:hypothetical protein
LISNDEMTSEDLPLVVWLRGDEEHCADFSLDAEAVMDQLGIKRSRLTQISGRELRVGRIRRGRYISPVYRQVDVETYLAWTRATASQQKSASLVGEATAELLEHSERLSDYLQSIPDQLTSVLRDDISRATLHVTAELRRILDQAHGVTYHHRDISLGVEGRLRQLIESQSELSAALLLQIQRQAVHLESLQKQMTELAGLVRIVRQESLDSVAARSSFELELLTRLDHLQAAMPRPKNERQRGRAESRRVKAVSKRAPSAPIKREAQPAKKRTIVGAQSTKPRPLSKRIKAKIESSIDKSLVSSTTASSACLSGAVSRP